MRAKNFASALICSKLRSCFVRGTLFHKRVSTSFSPSDRKCCSEKACLNASIHSSSAIEPVISWRNASTFCQVSESKESLQQTWSSRSHRWIIRAKTGTSVHFFPKGPLPSAFSWWYKMTFFISVWDGMSFMFFSPAAQWIPSSSGIAEPIALAISLCNSSWIYWVSALSCNNAPAVRSCRLSPWIPICSAMQTLIYATRFACLSVTCTNSASTQSNA